MSFYSKMISSLAALAIIGGGAAYVAEQSSEVLTHAKETIYDSAEYFILGEYNGKVALYKEGESEPLAVYSTAVSQINPADAVMLREGIRLRGMREVGRLLEDLDVE